MILRSQIRVLYIQLSFVYSEGTIGTFIEWVSKEAHRGRDFDLALFYKEG